MHKEYTDEEKQAAVDLALRSNSAITAMTLNIPKGNIDRWVADAKKKMNLCSSTEKKLDYNDVNKTLTALSKLGTELNKKEELFENKNPEDENNVLQQLVNLMGETIKQALITVKNGPTQNEPKAKWLQALAMMLNISVDKFQLIIGGPTAIQKLNVNGQVVDRRELEVVQRVVNTAEFEPFREQCRELFRKSYRADTNNMESRCGEQSSVLLGMGQSSAMDASETPNETV